jgi:hypothetical protein
MRDFKGLLPFIVVTQLVVVVQRAGGVLHRDRQREGDPTRQRREQRLRKLVGRCKTIE